MDFVIYLMGAGQEPKDLDTLQVCVRAVIVFFSALVLLRLSHKRFLSRMSAQDVVLGFILASVLSRAINGSARLLPTLAAGLVLVLCHRVLSTFTFYSDFAGKLAKGEPDVLVREGQPDLARLRKHRISEKDLLEEARLNGKTSEMADIKLAVLERNGQISVLPEKTT